MTLRLRLALAFATAFAVGFGILGLTAVRVAGRTVEEGLARRLDRTLAIIRENPAFFIHEAALREDQLRQLADISGFEIIVPGANPGRLAGSSLPRDLAGGFLRSAPTAERFRAELGGVGYLGSRLVVDGRPLYLLSPADPVEEAKRAARRPIFLVFGGGLAAAILLGILFAASVTKPLRRLAESAREVREGRLDVEIPEGGGRETTDLARAFREMLEGLARYRAELLRREKLATLGRFSASVAHEIRNPLSAMQMTAEMLRRSASPEQAEDLDLLLSEMARLAHSVDEILFHAGEPRYDFRPVALREVAEEAVRVLEPRARHLGIRLRLEAGEAPGPVVRGDRGKLAQALLNLLLNALQASPPEETVTVGVEAGEGRVRVRVRDRGPGIPGELLPRIFEPFVSGPGGGTGLGLSVTRAIAEAHGGAVRYHRERGVTTLVLELPRGG